MMARFSIIGVTLGGVALALSSGEQAKPSYIWNASQSVPVGLYRLQETGPLNVTELLAVQAPEPLASFLDLNGYLPVGMPMLKRVAALPGQTVCRTGLTITVDNIEMGEARERDGRGRPLPVWQGCLVIPSDQVFLMNWQSTDSLDGRYFGPIARSAVIGEAIPVWTKEE